MKYSKGAMGCQGVFGQNFLFLVYHCMRTHQQLMFSMSERTSSQFDSYPTAGGIIQQRASLLNTIAMNLNRTNHTIAEILRKHAAIV